MTNIQVIPPFEIFTDVNGKPLEDGFLYIGQQSLDPEANPISVFWDEALTQPATQPIRTKGGYPSNAGAQARFYVAQTNYSVRVKNKNGTVISADLDFSSLEGELADENGSSLVGFKLHPLTAAVIMAPKIERALLALPVNLWQFVDSITSKPDPDDMATWDWTPAFNAMYRYISDTYSQGGLKYGKSAYIPPLQDGTYLVNDDILIPRKGIATIGEGSQTSVIEFALGSTATWGIIAQNEAPSGNMGGTSFMNLGIDCAGVAVGGLNLEDGYDNVIFDDVRISRVHPDKIGLRMGPRTDGNPGQPLSQTINARSLFVYKNGGAATVPPIVLIKVQESQFIGCKSWAGGYGGAARGNTPAWYLEDCRSVHLQDCSSVGAENFGVEIKAQTKSSDGINITGHLYENCNGTTKTSTTDAVNFPIKSFVHTLPRIESPSSGGFDIGGAYGAMIEAGPTTGTLQSDSEQCQVNAQRVVNWTDNAVSSKRNVIKSYPNAVDNFVGFSKSLRVIASSTPRYTFGATGVTDFAALEWSRSSGANNGVRTVVNVGGSDVVLQALKEAPASGNTAMILLVNNGTTTTAVQVSVGAADSGGVGFRMLRVPN